MKAFLVEGQMEKRIVEKLCPNVPVRLIGVNGDDVAIPTIAKFVAAQLVPLLNRYTPIHVIFDRERRIKSCDEIRLELIKCLKEHQIDVSQVKIVIADRTTESWILPFLNDNGTIAVNGPVRNACDGIDSKGGVKSVFKGMRRPYVETVDGVKLFCALNPRSVFKLSPSFRDLFESFNDDCWWKLGQEDVSAQ